MTGLYRPGTSPLHRMPPGVKLLALMLLGALSILLVRWEAVAGFLAGVAALYAAAGFGPRLMAAQVRPLRWLLVFVGAFHVWFAGWERAVVVLGTLVGLVLAAALVTLTTRVAAMVDVVVRVASPLRRVVDPERLGLVLMLGIRCVPLMAELARQVREAQWARGTTWSLRAFAVPLLVRALRDADAMGEALVARGLDD